MIDPIILGGILISWTTALAIMPRFSNGQDVVKKRQTEPGENGAYDPSEDQEKIMRGEIESYFD